MSEAEKIRVSKLDAGRRQLDSAIEMWVADGDPVSVHTLACASHQIIHDINRKKGNRDLLFDSLVIKEEYRSEFLKVVRKDMNFFKHAEEDPEAITEFIPRSSEMFILFSILGLELLGVKLNDIEATFMFWVYFHNPRWLTEAGRKAFIDRIPVEHLTEIQNVDKSDFFKIVLRIRAEAQFKLNT
ncbi:MAG TPA: hypothetical protein VIW72_04565 [Burkholderiales bacterium]